MVEITIKQLEQILMLTKMNESDSIFLNFKTERYGSNDVRESVEIFFDDDVDDIIYTIKN